MKLRLQAFILVLICLVATASPIQAKTTGGSVMYHNWLKNCLDDIKRDVPSITKSAESAARLYVNEEYAIGVWGDLSLMEEFRGRSGGIIPIVWAVKDDAAKTIVLMTVRDDHLADDLRQAAEFEKQGNMVVGRPQ